MSILNSVAHWRVVSTAAVQEVGLNLDCDPHNIPQSKELRVHIYS